jgi:phosphonate metabolism protein (transferase hexapeptide repeat family)
MKKIEKLNISIKKVLSKEPLILENSIIKDVYFGEYVEVGINNNIQESSIDDFSYTSEYCQIIYSEIKKFVNIASFVRLNPGQHPMKRVTQHHMLYRREMFGFGSDDDSFFDWRREKKVVVGNDVWIGHNVTVMGGVTIGNGAVIGSGAIVTKDIPPFAIAVGNPAKVIKYRFDEKIIEKLEEIKWWDWDYEKIKSSIDEFNDIETFIEKYGK